MGWMKDLRCDLQRLCRIGITCPILGVMLRILYDKAYDNRMIGLFGKDEVYQEMSKAFFNILPLCPYQDQNKGMGDGWIQ